MYLKINQFKQKYHEKFTDFKLYLIFIFHFYT